MPKCPKCGKTIEFLKDYMTGVTQVFYFSLNDDGSPDYCDDELILEGGRDEFACPECGETLFTNEEDAINFLKSS
jgi:predicted RNA-binding Zn-ribbon protein involved in translation (DUF1610 family)